MALLETRREAKRCSVFLCKVSSIFETSYISQNDRFAVVANCYGDEAVAPSIFFQSVFFSSFHCSVTDVKMVKSPAV